MNAAANYYPLRFVSDRVRTRYTELRALCSGAVSDAEVLDRASKDIACADAHDARIRAAHVDSQDPFADFYPSI